MPKPTDQSKADAELEKRRLDEELDRQLEETFPASDAPKITLKQSPLPSRLKRRIVDRG